MKIKEVINKDHKFGEPDKYFALSDDSIEIEMLDGRVLKSDAPGMMFTENDLETLCLRAISNEEDLEEKNWFQKLFGL
jgi:hypothetical protein